MISSPPRQHRSVSWLAFLLCALAIFITIPLAGAIRSFVALEWGRLAFTYFVVACTLAVLGWIFRWLRRSGELTAGRAVWIVGIAAVYLAWTAILAMGSPEEAIHFLEYGLLSILAFRALSHDLRDPGIYLTAALLCSAVGTMDEAIQWLTPGRVWALNDIGLNVGSACLAQLALWRGIRPTLIAGDVAPRSWRWICRLGAIELTLLGLSLANTPSRIAWYAPRVPFLHYLLQQEGVMAEYGFAYQDAEFGSFYSRFTLPVLRETDNRRARPAAAILDAYRDKYPEFLTHYSPAVDPFVHEARVHLFRRDRFVEKLRAGGVDQALRADFSVVAFAENRILEKYFPATLAASSYRLSEEEIARIAAERDRRQVYVSPVSNQVITWPSERALRICILGLIATLIVAQAFIAPKAAGAPAHPPDIAEAVGGLQDESGRGENA